MSNLNAALEIVLNTEDAMTIYRNEGGETAGLKTPLQLFIKQWKHVIDAETEEIFNGRRDALHASFPCAVPYLTKYIWINQTTFVLCFVAGHVTLGIRSTQAAESQNSSLKGKLNVSSTTAVIEVFKRLEHAATAADQRNITALEKRRNEIQLPANATSIMTGLREKLSLYATNIIRDEYLRIASYNIIQHPNGRDWKVTASVIREDTTVTVTSSSMKCSCHTPTMTLLPCRHVLKANEHSLAGGAIQFDQVGNRWRLDYMPSLRLVEAAVLRRPIIPFHVAYPTVYFIQQPRSQTIRDRNEVLDALFNEFRAHIVNSEEAFISGRNQVFILLEHWRHKYETESHAETDDNHTVEEAMPSFLSPRSPNIGGISADQIRDPVVEQTRGRHSRKRIKSKGESQSSQK